MKNNSSKWAKQILQFLEEKIKKGLSGNDSYKKGWCDSF